MNTNGKVTAVNGFGVTGTGYAVDAAGNLSAGNGLFTSLDVRGIQRHVVGSVNVGVVNDHNPFGSFGAAGDVDVMVFNNGALTITGMLAGVQGQRLTIINCGTDVISLAPNDGRSAAANRFVNYVQAAPTPLAKGTGSGTPGGSATYVYDLSYGAWRLIAHEQGQWIQPAFSAANYINNGGTGLGCIAGSEITRAYYLRGRQLTFAMVAGPLTNGANATAMGVVLPNGFASARSMQGAGWINDGGVPKPAMLDAPAGSTSINFYLALGVGVLAASAVSSVNGTITLEVS